MSDNHPAKHTSTQDSELALPDFVQESENISGADFETLKALVFKEPPFDLTELGNAKRLVCILQSHAIWVEALNYFVIFKEPRWVKDTTGSVTRAWDLLLINIKQEKQFYEAVRAELEGFASKYNIDVMIKILTNRIANLHGHYLSSQTKNTIFASRELFKARSGISKPLESFDSKGQYIGCPNGVVDLRDGQLTPSNKSYLMMKTTNVDYVPDAECLQWQKFLDIITESNQEMIAFLQLLAGLMLIGEDVKDKLFILLGDGANGKSVYLDTLTDLLGDYAEQSSPDVLTDKRATKEYYLATLQGKRVVSMVETERGDKLEGAIVKKLVDSGRISARFAYGRPFSYQPVFTPILCTNYLPFISMDPATWRRLVIIPFNYTIPVEERDPSFRTKLVNEEGEGIFNWMVEGAIKYYQQGNLTIPESLTKVLNKHMKEFDNLAEFIVECSDNPLEDRAPSDMKCRITELRKVYEIWCKDNGYYPLNTRNFRRELEKKGYQIKKGPHGYIFVYGIAVTTIDNQPTMSVSGDILDKELNQ